MEADEVHRHLEKARKSGAYRCAPKDLAVAEANHAFARTELLHGNAGRAEEHLQIASAAVSRALTDSADCGPTQVLIRAAAPEVVVAAKDTDGDGIPDKDDACPEEPGPPENMGCPIRDRDGDGLPDDIDQCPDEAGPADNFGCPILDTDGDGILDDVDKCPEEPGIPELDGCPPVDTDGDGLPDHLDKCPSEPGPPELSGCPPQDRDGDGIPDHLDKCPDEPGVIEEQGCPRKYTLVVLKKEKIEIKEQVHFETNRHRILEDSFGLLDQVAQVLKDHPKLKVRVEGHTDSVGDDGFNMALSQRRADSVRDYLLKAGVAAERLTAVGYGETLPISSNTTARGRALNRRVEFTIVDK